MKRVIYIVLSSLAIFISGVLLLIPINGWIWKLKDLEGGYDDEMKMFDIVVFIEWPILIVLGALLGNYLYKKHLSKRLDGR